MHCGFEEHPPVPEPPCYPPSPSFPPEVMCDPPGFELSALELEVPVSTLFPFPINYAPLFPTVESPGISLDPPITFPH